ncbi:hypothetical protein AVEN_65421-1 [Araneus ventricosus]|uniref:Uncharacterized protein n=1 Tax=Araneus ventricosus TaxID=182803 RepID=A0A4Y2SNE4_ARAVE|nr:hypothetical protein AVEN_142991-1 [Araneus ventricosus]GBN88710.1 hypothetical protein AVEN_65421-1 [Araneus ventricosus]
MTLLRKHYNLQKTHLRGRHSFIKKNCQKEENYVRREGCKLPADFGPRTEKVNVRVHWQVSTRNRYTLRRHGMYIISVCSLKWDHCSIPRFLNTGRAKPFVNVKSQ